jgi:hypothetical protein
VADAWNLRHTNKVSTALGDKSARQPAVLFVAGVVGGEVELFLTLPEAMAAGTRLQASGQAVMVARLARREAGAKSG